VSADKVKVEKADWKPEQTLFRYHPSTGKTAAEYLLGRFPEMSAAERKEFLAMKEAGAVFLWIEEPGDEAMPFHIVELANFKFVCEVTGAKLTINEDRPQ
jgi:hypothetical protein